MTLHGFLDLIKMASLLELIQFITVLNFFSFCLEKAIEFNPSNKLLHTKGSQPRLNPHPAHATYPCQIEC